LGDVPNFQYGLRYDNCSKSPVRRQNMFLAEKAHAWGENDWQGSK